MAIVLTISSHVARGHVGNAAAVFALQRLGHDVWPVHTVMLPFHPGHGRVAPVATPIDGLRSLLDALADKGFLEHIDAVHSGYMANADQARAVADFVKRLKAAHRQALYSCDPIIGDGPAPGQGALYVPEDVAVAVSDELVPLADIVTPNLFELAWLTGRTPKDGIDVVDACQALGTEVCLVTSAPAFFAGSIATLLVSGKSGLSAETRRLERVPHGTGDLLAALFLGLLLKRASHEAALLNACGSLFDVLTETARLERDELALIQAQDALVHPRSQPRLQRIAGK